ncbi:proline and serine-rich protein 2 isoform X2 [Periophthalmus magnuspinnatus]|nr:proline and serine-rich protein 2 isoform X2 [Periophthalmus magnuspinnatus]
MQAFNNSVVDGASKSGPNCRSNPKDQDIIDLVRPKPDLVETKNTAFTPTNPDFQSLVLSPESHFEVKPRSDPDSLPLTEYNPSLPDSHPVYHPPGSIPTPVLIAQKIAETQTGGSTVLSASSLLRRRSSEFDKSTSSNKQGPPTTTKPARYPANISVILGNREQQNSSLANINIEERRAQMLANLSGTTHPLLQEDLQQDQTETNSPTRSMSFRDPTPEKSRMEALSKLGLARNRASSGGMPLPSTPLEPLVGGGASTTNVEKNNLPEASTSTSNPPHVLASSKHSEISIAPNVVLPTTIRDPGTPPSSRPQERSRPAAVSTNIKLPETSPRSPLLSYRKPDAPLPDSHRGFETKYSPPAYSQNYFPPPPPPATQAETSAEFNSYGGKSIVLNPTASFKSELPPSPVSPEPKSLSPILAAPTEFNSYGGKSKVMTPIPVPASRRDLPDILSSHIDKSQTQHSENAPTESNNYGGKTRMFNPSGSANRPSEGSSRTVKPPAPTPAPRPPRHSYHGPTAVPKPPQRALSPDNKRRTGSLFRPQGITVQFSGKGASEESRKEALKKLGLLKD